MIARRDDVLQQWARLLADLIEQHARAASGAALANAGVLGTEAGRTDLPRTSLPLVPLAALTELSRRNGTLGATELQSARDVWGRFVAAYDAVAFGQAAEPAVLDAMLRNVPGLVYRCRNDPAWTMEFVSAGCERLTGYPASDLVGNRRLSYADLIHPDDRQAVWDAVQAAVRAGHPFQLSYRLLGADGAEKWVWEQGECVEVGADGRQILQGLVIDISAQRRAEAALRESEREKSLVLAAVNELVVYQDIEMRVRWVNRAAGESVGQKPEDLVGRYCYEIWHQRSRPCVDCPVVRSCRDGRPAEGRITSPDGRAWLIHAYPVRDERGVLAGVVEVAQEITEQVRMETELQQHREHLEELVKQRTEELAATNTRLQEELVRRQQATQALRQSEELFRTVIGASKDAIVAADQHGCITIFNPAAEELLGAPAAEMIGQPLDCLIPPEYRAAHRQFVRDYFQSGRPRGAIGRTLELPILRQDGSTVPVELSLSAGRSGERQFVLAVIRDIRARKQADEALRLHREQLARVARISTVGEMAAGLAHELAQPLSAIRYYARGCITRLAANQWSTADALRTLEKISGQAERAGEFIRRLKVFVRRTQPQRALCDINEIVQSATSLATPEARQARVALELDLSGDLPPVLVDRIQIEQVILNLVRNGIEAMEHTPVGERRLLLRTYPGPDAMVCVSVHDRGTGLSDEIAERVFEPFFTTKPHGTGLGLSISRTIIEDMHEGRLWLRRELHRGAVFGFSLPACTGKTTD